MESSDFRTRASGDFSVPVLLAGAGDRGWGYARHSLSVQPRLNIIGVAEPDPVKRQRVARLLKIPEHNRFATWSEVAGNKRNLGKFAAVILATPDIDHRNSAIHFLDAGYDVLLEKPIAVDPEGLDDVKSAVLRAKKRDKGSLTVCHVLRYTPLFRKIHSILREGELGDVVSIYHAENITNHHMAHSYVRGNWGNRKRSSPILLAKSCHDLDLLYWFAGSPPEGGYSQGNLKYFIRDNAPGEVPEYCLSGCQFGNTCPYYAPDVYLKGLPMKRAISRHGNWGARLLGKVVTPWIYPWKFWPTSVISNDLTKAGILEALSKGPFGRCVYRCDNDQPDHIESVIRFQNGIHASFRLHGHSDQEGRTLRIDGTKATLKARFGAQSEVSISPHGPGRVYRVGFSSDLSGHGEADRGVVQHFSRVLQGFRETNGVNDPFVSHTLAFNLEQSRQTGLPFGDT